MTAGIHKLELHAPVPLAKGLDPRETEKLRLRDHRLHGCDWLQCNGRFVRSGSEKEAFRVHFGMTHAKTDVGRSINVLGRVVSAPREFPRQRLRAYLS